MSEEEDQYVVESVTRARVAKKPGKGKRLQWQYRVKWKGYNKPEDDTWEPTESFEGSEHFLEQFWQRASRKLEGRDIQNMSLFKAGEEFFPMGPPRKLKRKAAGLEEQSSPPTGGSDHGNDAPKSNKRMRASPAVLSDQDLSSQPNEERTQSTSHSRQSPPSRTSPRKPPLVDAEIIPPSDDEYEGVGPSGGSIQHDSSNEIDASEKPHYGNQESDTGSRHSVADVGDRIQTTAQGRTKSPRIPVPSHRQRVTNPLVKMVDDFKDMDGAISVKARLSGQDANRSQAPSSMGQPPRKRKPGPGRSSSGFLNKSTSSLLTAHKGQLKSVKGKYIPASDTPSRETPEDTPSGAILDLGNWNNHPVDVDEVQLQTSAVEPSIAPPTPHELLQMAGLDSEVADDLQDFEEGAASSLLDSQEPNGGSSSLLQQSLALAKDSLFPTKWSTTSASIGHAVTSAWKKSTIFGPLGSASDAHAGSEGSAESALSSPFNLTLDVTVTVPVVLKDMSSSAPPSLDSIVRNAPKGPPGKFYSREAALSVLDTLRTGGPSARVLIAPNASETQRHDFEKLKEKLNKDELFVIIVGTDVLAFCSSDSMISQRLNLPASLTHSPGGVLVGRVSIENHSAYANAAVEVDSTHW